MSLTRMRMLRMHALPPHCCALNVIRSIRILLVTDMKTVISRRMWLAMTGLSPTQMPPQRRPNRCAQQHAAAPKATRIDITRCGHAMAVPVPVESGKKSTFPTSHIDSLLSTNEQVQSEGGALLFAHSDWAGYSVFEEAFAIGHAAGGAT